MALAKCRQGLKASLPTFGIPREFRYCTDTKELYYNDGVSNIKVGDASSFSQAQTLADAFALHIDASNPQHITSAERTQITTNKDSIATHKADTIPHISASERTQITTNKDNITSLQTGLSALDFIKTATFNDTTGDLTFTFRDNSTLNLNVKAEGLLEGISYDSATKELVLSEVGGGETRVPLADLIDDYEGSNGTHIQIAIGTGNVINATLKAGTITENELSQSVKDSLSLADSALQSFTVTYDSLPQSVKDSLALADTAMQSFTETDPVATAALTSHDGSSSAHSALKAVILSEAAVNAQGEVINDLTTGGSNKPLSAEQGKNLKTLVDGLAFVKSSAYNSTTGDLTFTYRDNSTLTLNLFAESLAQDISYDSSSKEIVITPKVGSAVRISVSDLIDTYSGKDDTHIKVTVETGNVIKAVVKAGTITETELATALATKLNNKVDKEAGKTLMTTTWKDGVDSSLAKLAPKDTTVSTNSKILDMKIGTTMGGVNAFEYVRIDTPMTASYATNASLKLEGGTISSSWGITISFHWSVSNTIFMHPTVIVDYGTYPFSNVRLGFINGKISVILTPLGNTTQTQAYITQVILGNSIVPQVGVSDWAISLQTADSVMTNEIVATVQGVEGVSSIRDFGLPTFPALNFFDPTRPALSNGFSATNGGWRTGWFYLPNKETTTANIPTFGAGTLHHLILQIIPHAQDPGTSYYAVRVYSALSWGQSGIYFEKIFHHNGTSSDTWKLKGSQSVTTRGGTTRTIESAFGTISVLDNASLRVTLGANANLTRLYRGYLSRLAFNGAGALVPYTLDIPITLPINGQLVVPTSGTSGIISGYVPLHYNRPANAAIGHTALDIDVIIKISYDFEYGMGTAQGGGQALAGQWGVCTFDFSSDNPA